MPKFRQILPFLLLTYLCGRQIGNIIHWLHTRMKHIVQLMVNRERVPAQRGKLRFHSFLRVNTKNRIVTEPLELQ